MTVPRSQCVFGLLVCVCGLAGACGPGAGPSDSADSSEAPTALRTPWFTEVTAEVGLDVTAESWPDGSYAAPEIMGPGVALLDYDGDDDLDVLQLRMPLPGSPDAPAPNRLFQQQDDGTFVDISAGSGLDDTGFAQGVAVGDVNNDGAPDVYFANYGRDALYRNNGDGTFTNVTAAAGVGELDLWSASTTFCDYDADGDLDLYVTHYLDYDPDVSCQGRSGHPGYCAPQTFDGVPDKLYRNIGGGRFQDVTTSAGLRWVDGGRKAKGLGVVCVDLSGDGLLDFYVANDGEANQLWINLGDGSFADEAIIRGVAVNRYGMPEASMGIALGDVDGDGGLDLLLTHLGGENNTLFSSGSGPLYRDRTPEAGLAVHDQALTGFGCRLFDFDLDGDPDLAVVNGRVQRGPAADSAEVSPFWSHFAEPNLLFENDGGGAFSNVTPTEIDFGRRVEVSRGLAIGDVDDDGDLDLLLSNGDNSLRIYRNGAAGSGGHWLRVRARVAGRDAPGTRVRLIAADREFLGLVLPGGSYMSSGDPRAHFGLGATDRVDRIEVTWPDGHREQFPGSQADRQVELTKGTGSPA